MSWHQLQHLDVTQGQDISMALRKGIHTGGSECELWCVCSDTAWALYIKPRSHQYPSQPHIKVPCGTAVSGLAMGFRRGTEPEVRLWQLRWRQAEGRWHRAHGALGALGGGHAPAAVPCPINTNAYQYFTTAVLLCTCCCAHYMCTFSIVLRSFGVKRPAKS